MPNLFDPIRIGRLTLPSRIIMAPLTRGRTGDTGIANPLAAQYYAQRASAGNCVVYPLDGGHTAIHHFG